MFIHFRAKESAMPVPKKEPITSESSISTPESSSPVLPERELFLYPSKNQTQGKLSMGSSPLTPPPRSIGESKANAETMRNSLYEALQVIPDPRRGAGKRSGAP